MTAARRDSPPGRRDQAPARPTVVVAVARPWRVALRSIPRARSRARGVGVRWRLRRLGGFADAEPEPLVRRVAFGDRPKAATRDGDPIWKIRCQDTGVAEPFARPLTGEPVEIHAKPRRRERGQALRKERPDRAGEDVTRPATCERRVLERGDDHLAIR